MIKSGKNDPLIGFINIQSLPKKRRVSKNFDLTHLMLVMKFDHIGLAETSRHWTYLQEEYRITQRLRGQFMSQQIESITACNKNEPFLGPLQCGVIESLSTGNLTGRKILRERLLWPWQM